MTSGIEGGAGQGRSYDQEPFDGSGADGPAIDPFGHGHVVPVADGVAGESAEDRGEALVGLLAGLKPDPTGGPTGPILTKLPMVPRLDPAIRKQISPELKRLRWKFCRVNLPDGCYRITFDPNGFGDTFRGTVRVDRGEGSLVISGDLYRFPSVIGPIVGTPPVAVSRAATGSFGAAVASGRFGTIFRKLGIPVYSRGSYHSYLKGTGARLWSIGPIGGPCTASLSFQEYNYTQPAPGQFNGSFPAAPGTRTITLNLTPKPAPPNIPGAYFEGELVANGSVLGSISMGWVSSFFRKATIEVDTVQGAVAPQAVPALAGSGTEDFTTMMATAGWDARVVYDQINVPSSIPDPTQCWSDGQLHALMTTVRASSNVDTEWRMHLLVVQGNLNCSRGKMYDSIGTPREGVVSYSDDGYPTSHSSNFGAAANQMQRNVPRAFIRSASHELVHGFNQIHQEQEGGADNSIMTTTPSVADVLGGPATGAPGIFPDQIRLAVNQHVRHHMIHFPDPLVRPGGHTFASGHTSVVPQADKYSFGPGELALEVTVGQAGNIALGEPLLLSWTLTNTGQEPLPVPTDIGTAALYATVTVIDAKGRRREVRPFVIECEHTRIGSLEPGDSLTAETRVFWSTNGFAFTAPGAYDVEVAIDWTAMDVPCTVRAVAPVFVSFPQSTGDNEAASTLLHQEVGMWVALGGDAPHLTEAVERLTGLAGTWQEGTDGGQPPLALRGFDGLMPTEEVVADAHERAIQLPQQERIGSSVS